MTALNVLLSVRSRLRDEERRSLRFSDEELKIYLEIAQNALILEFDSNILEFKFNAKDREFKFNKRILGIFKVLLNNREIPNFPLTYALNSQRQGFTLTSEKSGKLNKQGDGELIVYANVAVRIHDLSEEMFLDEMFFNALVLGVLKQMILIETSEDNLNKTAPYENFYRQEIARLTTLINKAQSRKIHFTKFNRC